MPCPLGWTAATGQKTSEKIGDKPDFRQIADASRAVLGMLVAAKRTMATESQIHPTAASPLPVNGAPIADREKAPRTSAAPSPLRLSVIIPARNEEAQIAATIEQVVNAGVAEVIVVDGESSDRTRELARASGATVLTSAPGRGQQQNLGAQAASGDMLLFLHADTRLPSDFARADCLHATKRRGLGRCLPAPHRSPWASLAAGGENGRLAFADLPVALRRPGDLPEGRNVPPLRWLRRRPPDGGLRSDAPSAAAGTRRAGVCLGHHIGAPLAEAGRLARHLDQPALHPGALARNLLSSHRALARAIRPVVLSEFSILRSTRVRLRRWTSGVRRRNGILRRRFGSRR